jgi:hypothetical protein
MLHLAMRPGENRGLLLGMATAFVALYDVVAASALLSERGREVLRQIAGRGWRSIEVCLAEIRDDEVAYAQYCRGYSWGRAEIESCFEGDGALGGAFVGMGPCTDSCKHCIMVRCDRSSSKGERRM